MTLSGSDLFPRLFRTEHTKAIKHSLPHAYNRLVYYVTWFNTVTLQGSISWSTSLLILFVHRRSLFVLQYWTPGSIVLPCSRIFSLAQIRFPNVQNQSQWCCQKENRKIFTGRWTARTNPIVSLRWTVNKSNSTNLHPFFLWKLLHVRHTSFFAASNRCCNVTAMVTSSLDYCMVLW